HERTYLYPFPTRRSSDLLGVRGQPAFDPTKPWGLGQQAPLTPEYQAVLEKSVADQVNGGQGNWQSGVACLPPGMPAMMTLYRPRSEEHTSELQSPCNLVC